MLTRLVKPKVFIVFEVFCFIFKKPNAFLKGNGYERDFIGCSNVFIVDVFNKNIYPKDLYAESAISHAVKLDYFVQDYEYLTLVDR